MGKSFRYVKDFDFSCENRYSGSAGKSPNKGYARGGKAKVEKVMGEFKSGDLHSGSSSGPKVKSRAQAVAIALSEARKAKR